MVFGLILVAVGIIFLLQNLNIITGRSWEIIWPVIVIFVGIGFLFRPKRQDRRWSWGNHDKKEKEEYPAAEKKEEEDKDENDAPKE